MSSSKPGIDRPLTIVIAAMGGEGGGLLADWIVEGAKHSGILISINIHSWRRTAHWRHCVLS